MYSNGMTHVLYWLAGITAAELALWTPPLWRIRRVWSAIVIIPLSVTSGLLFGMDFVSWAALVMFFSIYRIVNLLRVLEGRMQLDHLFSATRRTSLWLIGLQAVVIGLAALDERTRLVTVTLPHVLVAVQLAVAAGLWLSTLSGLSDSRPGAPRQNLASRDLPSLSVAIPARNETEDLEACLESLIASDYPKLEILVLDDCSQNKRTSKIIGGFAQSGVVFIGGEVPPEHWLAKNYAYEQLAQEANGELILFCGVDTRFNPDSLRTMVEIMIERRQRMTSFVPVNRTPDRWKLEPLMLQPARYAWELALPRRRMGRPPVLSTCWLIAAEELRGSGGFEAVSRSISPESYFAKRMYAHGAYGFLRSSGSIGLSSSKSIEDQRATAVRTRYPQLHRRPELVALSALGELALLPLTFATLVINFANHELLLAAGGLIACAVLVDFYRRIVAATYGRRLLRGYWTVPFVALYDACLLNYSMWRYEFREVIWKGRNVCIPVMQTPPPTANPTAGSARRS